METSTAACNGTIYIPSCGKVVEITSLPTDPDEINKIIESFAPLVFHLAVRLKREGVPFYWRLEDLFQHGMLHLCKLMKYWSPDRGMSLTSYIGRCVAKELRKVAYRRKQLDNTSIFAELLDGLSYVEMQENDEEWQLALKILSKRERDIIIKRYEFGLTLKKIAAEYGVTKQAINLIEWNAKRKLQAHYKRRDICYV